jgi:hypothetical protein
MRLNNRYFLGLPVCEFFKLRPVLRRELYYFLGRNPHYLALAREFIIGAVVSGLICQYAPAFLRP